MTKVINIKVIAKLRVLMGWKVVKMINRIIYAINNSS